MSKCGSIAVAISLTLICGGASATELPRVASPRVGIEQARYVGGGVVAVRPATPVYRGGGAARGAATARGSVSKGGHYRGTRVARSTVVVPSSSLSPQCSYLKKKAAETKRHYWSARFRTEC